VEAERLAAYFNRTPREWASCMKLLVITPQLGFEPKGQIIPGGLQQFSRCIARALASSPQITHLGIWAQVDAAETVPLVRKMLESHRHDKIALDVRCFGGSKLRLAGAMMLAILSHQYDQVMYLLVNQAELYLLPGHPPYSVWEIGEELFQPAQPRRFQALMHAERLFSISHSTSAIAQKHNPGLPDATVVHLCDEPPLYEAPNDSVFVLQLAPYHAADRQPAVMILARLDLAHLYKGHKELIVAWSQVVAQVPNAELWIVGDGNARELLQNEAAALGADVAQQIRFFGRQADEAVDQLFRQVRVFAMPSTKEGFGIVFVEAARYGIPCIGGKHDSVKEIMLDGQTGLLVEQNVEEIASACIRLLTDDALANQYGEAGRQRYLNYFRFEHFRERLLNALHHPT
jgi:phosphatidyl-myo-inositol dimannoside synthase